jgi:hypothetical protein
MAPAEVSTAKETPNKTGLGRQSPFFVQHGNLSKSSSGLLHRRLPYGTKLSSWAA